MNETTRPDTHALEIYRVEYEKLKAEQTQRIQFRDNLLIAHLTVVGAVIGFIVANGANHLIAYAYLIIPWTSSVIGWTYLNNDMLISNIRDYLRDQLSPLLEKDLGVKQPFGWEHQVGSKRLWVIRKAVQTIMDTATFSIPALGALARLPYVPRPAGHMLFPWLIAIDVLITALLFVGMGYWNLGEIGQKPRPQPLNDPKKQAVTQIPAVQEAPPIAPAHAPGAHAPTPVKSRRNPPR